MADQIDPEGKYSLVEVHLETIMSIDKIDRTEWTIDNYIAAGEEASKLKFYSQWILGKLAYEYTGRVFGDVAKYAREIHIDQASLYAYKRVYTKIFEKDPNYVPDGFVPWGVLQIAAETEEPIKLIEELSADGKVSVEEAYRRKKEQEGAEPRPRRPRVRFVWDTEQKLWVMDMDIQDFENIDFKVVGKKGLVDYLRKVWNE